MKTADSPIRMDLLIFGFWRDIRHKDPERSLYSLSWQGKILLMPRVPLRPQTNLSKPVMNLLLIWMHCNLNSAHVSSVSAALNASIRKYTNTSVGELLPLF